MENNTILQTFCYTMIGFGLMSFILSVMNFARAFSEGDAQGRYKALRNVIVALLLLSIGLFFPDLCSEIMDTTTSVQNAEKINIEGDQNEINENNTKTEKLENEKDLHDTDNNDEIKASPSKTKHFAN